VTRRLGLIAAAWLACVCVGPSQGQDGVDAAQEFRWPQRIAPVGETSRGVLFELDGPYEGWSGWRTAGGDRSLPDLARASWIADWAGIDDDAAIEFEGPGAYLVRPSPAPEGQSGDGASYGVFWSLRPARGEEGPRLTRTWFRSQRPGGEAVGLALIMPGMFGTPEPFVDRLERALLLDGWHVLRMLSPPSRVTETFRAAIDLSAPGLPGLAALAVELDERAAESAYAVQAGLRWVRGQHEGLAGAPVVAVAMSGSGIVLPTVAAYLPGELDAAVIIAGGANAAAISRESSYRSLVDAVRFSFTPPAPGPEQLAEMDRLYLELSELDAAHTARALHGSPVLMVHANNDTAVPAALGELLWQRLGEPERWSMTATHELVFLRMALRLAELTQWLRGAVSAAPAGPPGAAP
jgi:hypothetical protein